MKSFSEIRFDIVEALTKGDDAGKWISDFMKSDAPQFAGKSDKKKKQMALAAYYAKQNESKEAEVKEPEEVEKKEDSILKKAKKKEVEEKDCSCDEELKGDQHKLDKNKNGKLDKHDFKLLRKEGWEEMMKAVKDKSKPQPNGGSGKKQGSRYGGSKQKEEPVKEGLKPEHGLKPGWMLKKDPELAKKIEAKTKAYKALAKYAGKKIEKKD
jgi:hypothetical protein